MQSAFKGHTGVKTLPAKAGDARNAGLTRGREGPLEEGMATHSSILAWRVPPTEEPGELHSESDTTEVNQRQHSYSHPWDVCARGIKT